MKTIQSVYALLAAQLVSCGLSVFSQEVREFSVPHGKSLLGVQWMHGDNTVAEVFPYAPEGLLLFTYDCGYRDNQFAFGKWVHPDHTLRPGQGIMIDNPGDTLTLSFPIEEIVTDWELEIRSGRNLIALPESGLSSIAVEFMDQIIQWSEGKWTTLFFDDLDQDWLPNLPLPKPGDALFYVAANAKDRREGCDPVGFPVYFNNYLPTNGLMEPIESITHGGRSILASATDFSFEIRTKYGGESDIDARPGNELISVPVSNLSGYIDTSLGTVGYALSSHGPIQVRGWPQCLGNDYDDVRNRFSATVASEWVPFYPDGFWPFTFDRFGWRQDVPLGFVITSVVFDGKVFITTPVGYFQMLELEYRMSKRFPDGVRFHWQRWSPGNRPDRGWETFESTDSDGISEELLTLTDPIFEAYRVIVDYGCIQYILYLSRSTIDESVQIGPLIEPLESQIETAGDTVQIRIGTLFLDEPENVSVTAGGYLSLQVTASGLPPLAYQWYKDYRPIPGATEANFRLAGVEANDAGRYDVQVSNPWSSDFSSAISLTVRNRIGPLGDFGNDVKPYIVFQDEGGALAVWNMDKYGLISANMLDPGGVADPAYRVAGSADFNWDGRKDLLFQHADGTLAVWFMDGAKLLRAALVEPGNPGDPKWRAVSLADFDRDGNTDIIFQHEDGTLALWYLREIALRSATLMNPSTPGSASWRVVGSADFNSDKQPDLLFQKEDGALVVWLMREANLTQGVFLSPPYSSAGWRVVSVMDRNGDGWPDLLFQHTNFDLAVWFMNGTSLTEARLLTPRNPGGTWRVVAPR